MQNFTSERNNLGKADTKKPLKLSGSHRFLENRFIKTTCFEDDLVNCFFENQGEQTIKHFNKEDPVKVFGKRRQLLSAEKFYTKTNFALKILEEKAISLCGQQVKTTGVPGVFYSEESSELKTGNLKITMEMFLSSVVDTFKRCLKFRTSQRERIFLMKIRTLQCEIQRLKIQSMIEISIKHC